MSDPVTELEGRIGFVFADRERALAALTHRTWFNENLARAAGHNERLEFLGDAVIDLAISDRLMARYPQAREGQLTRLRSQIVSEEGLSETAIALRLGELLRLGRGEERSGGRAKPSLLADALEAVIAAIYLDGGLPAVFPFVDRFFGAAIERVGEASSDRDWKTQAQELAHRALRAKVRYRVVKELGPEHERIFVVEAVLRELTDLAEGQVPLPLELRGRMIGVGEGRNKQAAEQVAAKAALASLPTLIEQLAAGTLPPAEPGAPLPDPEGP